MFTKVTSSFSRMMQGVAYRLAGTRWAQVSFLRNAYYAVQERIRSCEIMGNRMYLGRRDNMILQRAGVYEPQETAFILSRVRPGQVVVDIGANVGYYSLLMRRGIGPTGKLYAFEPNPDNFRVLKKNIRANHYVENCVLRPVAIAAVTGRMHFYLSETNQGDGRLYGTDGESRGSVEVEVRRLDDEILQVDRDRIAFIKIDVQGAEMLVASGMGEVLDQSKSVEVLSEFWPVGLRRAGSSAREYLEFWASRGMHAFEIVDCKLRPIDPETFLLRFQFGDENHFTNVFFTRSKSPAGIDESAVGDSR